MEYIDIFALISNPYFISIVGFLVAVIATLTGIIIKMTSNHIKKTEIRPDRIEQEAKINGERIASIESHSNIVYDIVLKKNL